MIDFCPTLACKYLLARRAMDFNCRVRGDQKRDVLINVRIDEQLSWRQVRRPTAEAGRADGLLCGAGRENCQKGC